MKKGLTITLAIIGVVVLALAGSLFLLSSEDTTTAFLYVDGGVVDVDIGSGWQSATNEMALSAGSKVRTGDNSEASLVFFEQDVMTLEANSQVTIATLSESQVSVNQDEGSTWNRVEKLAGREYTVTSPTSVATVRGTGFGLDLTDLGDDLLVEDGLVEFENKESGETVDVAENEFIAALKSGELQPKDLTIKQLERLKIRTTKDVERLKQVRIRGIQKNNLLLKQAEKRFGITLEDIENHLEKVDEGTADFSAAEGKVPKAKLNKLKRVTKRISRLQERCDRIEQRIKDLS